MKIRVRIVDERAREREAPLHAARKRLDARRGARSEAGEIEQPWNALADRALRNPEVAAVDEQVLLDGEIGIEVVHLRHDAHADARAAAPRRARAAASARSSRRRDR